MTTIYIVTEGDYSDYHICAVFDDSDVAQVYASHIGADVEEWELNELTNKIQSKRFPYFVHIYVDSAEIRYIGEAEMNLEMSPDNMKPTLHEDYYGPTPERLHLALYVIARDREHAAKIAMEKRTQWLLENDYAINSQSSNS